MLVVRPAALEDLEPVARLAALADSGLTTLPDDKELLRRRLLRSRRSFAEIAEKPGGELYLYHSLAFAKGDPVIEELRRKFSSHCRAELILVEVRPEQVPVAEAVESYLFNSHLVSLPEGGMCLVAPCECRENAAVARWLPELQPFPAASWLAFLFFVPGSTFRRVEQG